MAVNDICNFLKRCIERDERWLNVFREIGVLTIISNIINHFSRINSSFGTRKPERVHDFPLTLFESFGEITDLLVILLKNAHNRTYFRDAARKSIYDCLFIKEIQPETFKVVNVGIIFI